MTNEIATPKAPFEDFKEKLSEKIRNDIGSLLPDSVIHELIAKAVEKEFFQEREVGNGYNNKKIPSWFVQSVVEAARPMMEAHIKDYVTKNEDVIKKAMDEFISKESLLMLSLAAMQSMLSSHTYSTVENILQRVKQGY